MRSIRSIDLIFSLSLCFEVCVNHSAYLLCFLNNCAPVEINNISRKIWRRQLFLRMRFVYSNFSRQLRMCVCVCVCVCVIIGHLIIHITKGEIQRSCSVHQRRKQPSIQNSSEQ